MTYKLLTHTNQHGYGVSLIKENGVGETVNGFVLNAFPRLEERRIYVRELSEITGWPVEHLTGGE